MICTKCGTTLVDDAKFCTFCGYNVIDGDQNNVANATSNNGGYQQPPINQGAPRYNPMQSSINGTAYLIFAILSTVLCCLPLGIPAIIYATKIDKFLAMGDYQQAQEHAKKAKIWTIVSASVAVIGIILYFILVVVVGMGSFIESGGFYY